jgi:phage terminase small subunit
MARNRQKTRKPQAKAPQKAIKRNGSRLLSALETRFIAKLIELGRRNQAMIEAGYAGTDPDSAAQRALDKPKVRREYHRRLRELEKETGASAVRVINEAARLAFSSLSEIVEYDARKRTIKLRDLRDIAPDAMAAVQQIKISKGGEVSVRMHGKMEAIALLARILDIGRDDGEDPAKRSIPLEEYRNLPKEVILEKVNARQLVRALPAKAPSTKKNGKTPEENGTHNGHGGNGSGPAAA